MEILLTFEIPDMKHYASQGLDRLFQNGKYHNAGGETARGNQKSLYFRILQARNYAREISEE
jgi:hypothetical protein